MRNKIAVITPYFGKFPAWIDLYFHSCAKNSFIDWYFFTDCSIPAEYESNIFFKEMTFAQYCRDVSKILNIDFAPTRALKLCDLKPFYGFIHSDILKNYDFWGFGDVDLVWGDLAQFYTPEMFAKYDVFSTHNNMLSGHLALLRNSDKYVNLCFKISDWKNKLKDEENLMLDEGEFSNILFPPFYLLNKIMQKIVYKIDRKKRSWQTYSSFVHSFSYSFGRFNKKRYFFKEQYSTPSKEGDFSSYDSNVWFYKNGKIYNERCGDNKEFIYFHWMNFKSLAEFKYSLPDKFPFDNGILINTKGFVPIEVRN